MIQILLTVIAGVAAASGLLVVVVWLRSGEPRPLLDRAGRRLPDAVSEKRFVDINGVRQGMVVKSRNRRNPVLLYLHGGMPEYFLTARYPTRLEDLFTVIWWDQRGAGLSYRPGMDTRSITSDVLVEDTIALAEYLRREFGQERVYLMAHSGGTYIGVEAVTRRPDLFHAYVGVAQIVDQVRSERLAHAYMVEAYRKRGDERRARRLAAVPVDLGGGGPSAYLRLRDGAMHELGVGTTRDMRGVVSGLFWPSLWFEDYGLGDKLNLWRGKAATGVSAVWREIVSADLAQSHTTFAIPIYLFHGVHDYTCAYELARAYAARVHAPVKGFYSFHSSAHSPSLEEPARCLRILQEDVLTGRTTLADVVAGGR